MALKHESRQLQIQREFFAQLGSTQQFHKLFEYLEGIYFFCKDADSRMMAASTPILKRLGVASEAEVVGTNDYDYFPEHIADSFVRDDQQVISTGVPLIDRVEIWYTEQRLLDWFVTTKLPLMSAKGKIIGIYGTVRSYDGHRRELQAYSDVEEAVDYIRSNHRFKFTVEELAEHLEISTRQLNRRFKNTFKMSVQEFINKTRIQAACDELIFTKTSISDIATDLGYYDQSAFGKQFLKQMGVTPLQFRNKHK